MAMVATNMSDGGGSSKQTIKMTSTTVKAPYTTISSAASKTVQKAATVTNGVKATVKANIIKNTPSMTSVGKSGNVTTLPRNEIKGKVVTNTYDNIGKAAVSTNAPSNNRIGTPIGKDDPLNFKEQIKKATGPHKPAIKDFVVKSTGCGGVVKPSVQPKVSVATGCSITKPGIKTKEIKIPLTTSKGKKLNKGATAFLKDGSKIVAGGLLGGPAGAGVATAVVTRKTLVANLPALREQSQKAKQISNELVQKLQKSVQTLDLLGDKWQGQDAKKYIESTKDKLKNLEVISKVIDLYQQTSEKAVRKVEETQSTVINSINGINN